jgi:hypothetical protein
MKKDDPWKHPATFVLPASSLRTMPQIAPTTTQATIAFSAQLDNIQITVNNFATDVQLEKKH